MTSGPEVTNCANMNFLSEVQRKLCGQERRLPRVISDGASLGIGECKHQFGNRRWNCSTYNSTDVFGGILKKSRSSKSVAAIENVIFRKEMSFEALLNKRGA